jgi:hypothetical protein
MAEISKNGGQSYLEKVNAEIPIKVTTHQITHSADNMRRSWRVDNALRKQAFACNRTCGIVRQTSWIMKIGDIVVAKKDNVGQRSGNSNKKDELYGREMGLCNW